MKKHKLIVITGATGTGKTTVSRYLTENYHIYRVMTHTTRPERFGEENGVDYYFETPQTFATKHYIEHVTYAGFEYGSSRESLQKAWSRHPFVSIVLDTQGAQTYADTIPASELIVIFLTIADPAKLRERLLKRGDVPDMVAQRLASAEYARDLQVPARLANQAYVVANDDWAHAKLAIDQIMKKEARKLM